MSRPGEAAWAPADALRGAGIAAAICSFDAPLQTQPPISIMPAYRDVLQNEWMLAVDHVDHGFLQHDRRSADEADAGISSRMIPLLVAGC